MKQYFGWIFKLGLVACGFGMALGEARAQSSVIINHINDVTHFELPEVHSADYSLVQKSDHVELAVSQLDAVSANSLRGYSDQFIQKITVDKSASLNKDIIRIYPQNPNVEVFDYLTDTPVALSVDFYLDDQKTAAKARKSAPEIEEGPTLAAKTSKRSPSSTEFIKIEPTKPSKVGYQSVPTKLDYTKLGNTPDVIDPKLNALVKSVTEEGFDLINFDANKVIFNPDSIIEARGKLFLKWPILQSESRDIDQITRKKVAYEIEDADDKETKHAIELHKLFVDGRYRDFIKGKKNFSKKYPNSKYDHMLKYMQADSVYELSRIDTSRHLKLEALNLYDAIVKKYPESPLAERTILFTSLIRTQMGDHIGAIRSLKYYQTKYLKSPLRSNIDLLLAQNLLRASEFKGATDIYSRLIYGADPEIRVEAAYNIGDAFFERKEYKKAISLYETAWKQFPKEKERYPNAYFNKAEAEFVEEDYKTSLESFRDFLKHFPQHAYAPYAMTRLGEIFEIVGEDPAKWRGYYNESVFRYKSTVGGAVAKVRLLWHQVITSENKRLQLLVDDMTSYEKMITLPQADEFMIFQLTDAYFSRGLYKRATDELLAFFKKVERPLYVEKFQRRIGRGIAYQIKDHIAKNELKEAFKVYENYDEVWFKKSERVDYGYLKGVAYEKAKVYPAAIQAYNEFLNKFNKLADPESVRVYEGLPTEDFIQLRLAKSYLENKQYGLASGTLSKIKLSNISEEEKDEFYMVSAKIDMNNERWSAAIGHLDKISKGSFDIVNLKADVQASLKQPQKAIDEIDKYLDSEKTKKQEKFHLLKRKIALMEEAKAPEAELFSYMERFHQEFKNTDYNYDEIKYKLGAQWAHQKKFKEAEDVWSSISEGNVWKNLAAEAVKDKKWNDQYKKYIDRIPAMADKKENSK